MTRTILELERALHADQDAARPPADRLVAIRRAGRSQRRRRRVVSTAASAGVLAVVGGLGWVTGAGGLGGAGTSGDRIAVDQPPPTELSPLAERALKEIPGARKVSAYQVLLPDPNVPTDMDEPLDPQRLATEPVALPAGSYTGVTLYPEGTFPAWLVDGVDAAERAAGDENGRPVGSTAEGIVVDQGTAWMTCLRWDGDACTPTIVHRTGEEWFLDWGMGTDDFLQDGADMEVFGGQENFASGRPTELWIAGVDGEVARADFVQTDGRVVRGTVAYDTVSAGDSMMWAVVPGELARVVAYAADGSILEDHPLRPCDTPVECEVR